MHDGSLDQAAGLRRLSAPRSAKVIAITGGKGGVGKTLTAVNLGAALARLGRNTMLLDADFGLANVDVLLGMKARLNLEHVVSGQCALEDVVLTASSGLRVVPASSGSINMASMSRLQHAGLIGAFSQLMEPLDVLLVDTAAGLSDGVITFSVDAISASVPRRDLGFARGGAEGCAMSNPTGSPDDRATEARPSVMSSASRHLPSVSSGNAIEAEASTMNHVASNDRSSASLMYARSLRARSFQSSCRGSSPCR